MPSAGELASNMVAALRAAEPNLDTSIGTPIRKILDVVAESMAEVYTDSHLINYQYDIDSKAGGDLDDFVALFGFSRIRAQRAQGTVTFGRPAGAAATAQVVVIQPGAQVVALINPQIYVQTTVSAVMDPGQLTVDVPVIALTAGPQGNVGAGLLTTFGQGVPGLTSVTNTGPLSGGTAQESDEQLRARFKATVFRSLAGTAAMYAAIPREIPQDVNSPGTRAVSHTNVIGSSKRFREQIQIIGGTANTTLQNAAYIYADNMVCGANIDSGQLLTPTANFTFTPTNPTNGANASAVLAAVTGMPDGIYDLEFEYVPQRSRNDPADTRFGKGPINNRVDVYCNGVVAEAASQSIVFSDALRFSDTTTNPYYRQKFLQGKPGDGIPPLNGVFVPVAFGPLLTVPVSLVINSVTYVYQTDYWICWRDDAFGYSPRSLYGLAWLTAHKPANGAVFSLNYTYNRVARDAQDAIDQWRLLGTDAWAHTGRQVPVKFHLAVVYDRRFTPSSVNSDINTALSAFLGLLGFGAPLQVSDVLQVVHNVPGVDNVRLLSSTDDAVSYAMTRMSSFAPNTQVELYASGGRAIDVQFQEHEYPILHSTRIIPKAANSFGQY
jgi:uncharacterized phage protein gp47/JayE